MGDFGESFFAGVPSAAPVEQFGLIAAYKQDEHPDKVNLVIGSYKTDEGKPWVLPVVRKVEIDMANDPELDKEYLPIAGHAGFCKAVTKLVLGEDSPAIKENRVTTFHCPGGTPTLRLAAECLSKIMNLKYAYYGDPGWVNHMGIFDAGGMEVRKFSYWDSESMAMNWAAYEEALKTAPEGSVFIMQLQSHNPTGVVPTVDQWKKIAAIMKERRIFPLFDNAYQGLVSGDLDEDAWAPRYFVEQGFECMITQTFSKNFGLYNERVGSFTMVMREEALVSPMKQQLELIVRKMYSNPPSHGGRIIHNILTTPELTAEWKEQVQTMATRITEMRQMFYDKLVELGTPGSWDHVLTQSGMFCFTCISAAAVEALKQDYHIYTMFNGRITVCGLTTKNLDYVCKAFCDVLSRNR